VSFDHSGLNLKFSLTRDGVVEYHPLKEGTWRIRLSIAPSAVTPPKGDLFHADHFLNTRAGEFEQTLSTEKDWTRHFFLLPRSIIPPDTSSFVIRIQGEGIGPLEYDKERHRLIFKDISGKTLLVYSRPLIRDSMKKVIHGEFELNGADLTVTFPANPTFPLALVFGLTSIVLPDEESIGLKLSAEESGSNDSGDDSGEKSPKLKLKVPEIPSPSFKIGDKREKQKRDSLKDLKRISLDISKRSSQDISNNKGRRRSFGGRWIKSLFGDKTDAILVEGEATTIEASFGPETVFRKDGSAEFSGPEWTLEASPMNLSSEPPQKEARTNFEFTRGAKYAISKQDLWEGGISMKKDCSKHYFVLTTPPPNGKFSLKLNTKGLQGSYDKERGFVIFAKIDTPQLVYVPALMKQANEVSFSVPLLWSDTENTISITLPDSPAYPITLVFATWPKIPTQSEVSKGLGIEHAESDSDNEGDKKSSKLKKPKLPSIGLPNLSLSKNFHFSLYGKVDPARFDSEFKVTSKTAALVSPGTDLQFTLTTDDVFTVTPAKASAAQAWSVRIVPSHAGRGGEVGQLFKGNTFVSLRGPDLEQGVSIYADTTKHFFLLGKRVAYSLRFEAEGLGNIQHDIKSGKTIFNDMQGFPLFVYSRPSLKVKDKKVIPTTTWDERVNELHIDVPKASSYPIGVVCAICTCTLPPANVIYSSGDGFVVLHPKVNFIGHATLNGILFKPLRTTEEDTWSINFSLENSQVTNICAKSKCTVALSRTNDITEYLSYVDRGGYFGLHHSFHIHASPKQSNADPNAPLQIPIALGLKGITHVTEEAHGVLTFHASHGPVFSYEQLTVCDAHGTVLHSQMHHKDGRVVLEILERGEYPLVVS
jgi:hypothetical protein